MSSRSSSNYSQASYFSTLCTASALLAAKISVVHLLVVRSRFLTEDPAISHDTNGKLNPFLKKVLLCDVAKDKYISVRDGERLEKNCAENEPFFLLLASLAGLTGAVPVGVGTTLITTYTASRLFHSVVFFLGDKVNASVRSVPYVLGLTCTVVLSAFGLKGSN